MTTEQKPIIGMFSGRKKKKKVKGNFNRTTRQKDKHQIIFMNRRAKGYRKCFGFLADNGTCTNPQQQTV